MPEQTSLGCFRPGNKASLLPFAASPLLGPGLGLSKTGLSRSSPLGFRPKGKTVVEVSTRERRNQVTEQRIFPAETKRNPWIGTSRDWNQHGRKWERNWSPNPNGGINNSFNLPKQDHSRPQTPLEEAYLSSCIFFPQFPSLSQGEGTYISLLSLYLCILNVILIKFVVIDVNK